MDDIENGSYFTNGLYYRLLNRNRRGAVRVYCSFYFNVKICPRCGNAGFRQTIRKFTFTVQLWIIDWLGIIRGPFHVTFTVVISYTRKLNIPYNIQKEKPFCSSRNRYSINFHSSNDNCSTHWSVFWLIRSFMFAITIEHG